MHTAICTGIHNALSNILQGKGEKRTYEEKKRNEEK
jgi:hypothetical protein